MNSITVKVLGVVLSVFVLIMVGSQVFFKINDSHDTEEAVLYSVNENISFKGMFIRDETVVEYDGGGVINYLYQDGSKVSDNSVIADVYDSEEQIFLRDKRDFLRECVNDLKRAQSPGTTNYVQAETLRAQINEKYNSVMSSISNADYASAEYVQKNLLYLMNVYNIVTNAESNFKSTIKRLKAQIREIKTQIADPVGRIKIKDSGYFVKNVDGYESVVDCESISEMSAEQIQGLFSVKTETPGNTIGKLMNSYEWKFAGVIKNTNKFLINDTLMMRFNSSNKIYDVNVEDIKPLDGTNNSVIILSCDELDESVLQRRFDNAELIFKEYSGVKVPRSAIRFKGEDKGVYVILGKEITFKKIDVIYEGDDYVLSKNTSDENYLLLYDQILLEEVAADEIT